MRPTVHGCDEWPERLDGSQSSQCNQIQKAKASGSDRPFDSIKISRMVATFLTIPKSCRPLGVFHERPGATSPTWHAVVAHDVLLFKLLKCRTARNYHIQSHKLSEDVASNYLCHPGCCFCCWHWAPPAEPSRRCPRDAHVCHTSTTSHHGPRWPPGWHLPASGGRALPRENGVATSANPQRFDLKISQVTNWFQI